MVARFAHTLCLFDGGSPWREYPLFLRIIDVCLFFVCIPTVMPNVNRVTLADFSRSGFPRGLLFLPPSEDLRNVAFEPLSNTHLQTGTQQLLR